MEASAVVRVFEVGVNTDEDRFGHLLIDGDDEFSFPFFDLMASPNPVADRWTSPPVYVDRPTLPLPDFVHLWGGDFVLGADVPDDLRQLLAIAAELLPLDLDGERLDYVHVTKVLNVVDHTKSVWDAAGVGNPLAFLQHRLDELPLFRVPENNASQTFCTQGYGEFDFKGRVEDEHLTGLTFREAWNSDVGGILREWRS
jgi:hypothetical protein